MASYTPMTEFMKLPMRQLSDMVRGISDAIKERNEKAENKMNEQ